MTKSRSTIVPRLLLISAAVLFSTGGAAIKATALTGWQVAGFRSLVAAAALLAFVPSARKNWRWRAAPVALAYASVLILFVTSTKLTTAANAIFLQSTAPLYLLFLAPLLLKEPIHRRDIGLIAVAGAGIAFIFAGADQPLTTAPDPARGNLLGALTGLAWALTLTGLRRFGASGPGATAPISPVVAGNFTAFLICLPLALPVSSLQTKDVLVILYLGVVQIGIAYACLASALRHIPAFEASALLLLEPALNPVWTWMFHGEQPSTYAIIGGCLILTASLVHTFVTSRAFARAATASGG